MNNSQSLALADRFARRVADYEGESLVRLSYAYQLAFSRQPTEDELTAIRSFWMRFPTQIDAPSGNHTAAGKKETQYAALSAFCQALFASAEFRYLN